MKEFIEKLIGRLEEETYDMEICEEQFDMNSPYFMDVEYKMVKFDDVKEIVNQLAEEYNNGWIPCSERLPDNDDEVLCWYEYRIMQGTHVGEMKRTYGIGYYFNRFKHWGGEVSCGVDCKVIAWQPLPEPYKTGE